MHEKRSTKEKARQGAKVESVRTVKESVGTTYDNFFTSGRAAVILVTRL